MLNICVCTQEARLEECDRMLVAMDLAMWFNDGISMLQAVVICYGLLTPLIFHQVKHSAIVEVHKNIYTRCIFLNYITIISLIINPFDCVCPGAQKMFGSFRSDFTSSKAKLDWKNLRVICAHDSLYQLLPCKGVCLHCIFY